MGRVVRYRHATLLLLALLSACGEPEPQGQVIARVNGVDVTRRDLMVEAQASGLPADADMRSIQAPLLDRIITRQLAVNEALRLELEKTPEFQGELRRTRSILLADALRRRLGQGLSPPGEQDVRTYMATHPHMFAQRRQILADVLALPAGEKATGLLRAGESFAAFAARMTQVRGLQPGTAVIDSATLSRDEAAALDRSTAGAPVVLHREREGESAIWIAAKREVVAHSTRTEAERIADARQWLMAQRADAALRAYGDALRQSATIRMQSRP